MLPNLPIAPPNLPARRQPQAPAEPVRARTGADLPARREPRGAEPSFKELLRRDLSATQGKDRPAKPADRDGAADRGGSLGSAETSEVRATDDAAAGSSRDKVGAPDDRSGGSATRDDTGDRGQATDEGDDTQVASGEAEAAATVATSVAAPDTPVLRVSDGAAIEAGPASHGEAAQATPRDFGATLGAGLDAERAAGADLGANAGRAPTDAQGSAGPAVTTMVPDGAQQSGQQIASPRNPGGAGPTQRPPSLQPSSLQPSSIQPSSVQPSSVQPSSLQPSSTQPATASGLTAQSTAAPGAPLDATSVPTGAATSPSTVSASASNTPGIPAKSTEPAAGSTASPTRDVVRIDAAGTAPAAEGDTANAAIRALEDAVLAARADRASSPSDAASRAADPALARVAAMEADLAAERVAQALGQGLVEFEAFERSARATTDATTSEKRPSANTTLGADTRAMADAMAADRGGSDSATASTASSGSTASTHASAALPTAGAPQTTASGMAPLGGMLGTGGPAADLARQPSDGASPGAQLAAKGLGILANQRGGAITMRLEPPALGQLRIQLQVSQGAVVADFTAATAEARALLEANLGMLRERLESQGLSVERITIHGARSADAATQSSGDQRQEQGGNADARDRGGERRQDAAGGESRGRRDRDPGDQHELAGRANRRQGGFASALDSASMTPAARRSA